MFIFFRFVLVTMSFMWFYVNFKIFYFCEECHGITDGIALNLYIDFGRIVIFTVLFVIIDYYRRSLQFLES